VDARDIRAFVERDWARIADAKDAFWVTRKARMGAVEGLRASDELRRQVLLMRPTWPEAEDRAADLMNHAALSRRLRDASASSRR
jgi:hypothetical protein